MSKLLSILIIVISLLVTIESMAADKVVIIPLSGSSTQPTCPTYEFIVIEFGTITDTTTDIMWQQEDDGNLRNWEDATTYCEELALGGLTGWRLPTRQELMSLVKCTDGASTPLPLFSTCGAGHESPTIAHSFSCSTSRYWSATSYDLTSKWTVDFTDGGSGSRRTSATHYSRCVR